MSVRFYDEALHDKIAKWVKDPNLKIYKPDESTRLFEQKADETNDQPLKLPFIALSRDKSYEILNVNKRPLTFDGLAVEKTKNKVITLDAVPIKLSYQLDIYTKDLAENDEYQRNFIFNLINYPNLIVELPYNNMKLKHRSKIDLETTVTDNSDIKEHLLTDQFTRYSLRLDIEDAYLFSLPTHDIPQIIGLDFEVEDRITHEILESEPIIESE